MEPAAHSIQPFSLWRGLCTVVAAAGEELLSVVYDLNPAHSAGGTLIAVLD